MGNEQEFLPIQVFQGGTIEKIIEEKEREKEKENENITNKTGL